MMYRPSDPSYQTARSLREGYMDINRKLIVYSPEIDLNLLHN